MRIKNIFNKNISKLWRWILFFVGLFLCISMGIIYKNLYLALFGDKGKITFMNFIRIAVTTELFTLGSIIILSIFDLTHEWIKNITIFLLGVFTVLIFILEPLRIGILIFILIIIIFILINLIRKIYCTITTFSFLLLPFLGLSSILIEIWPNKLLTIIYITIVTYIILYTILGVKINNFVLKNFFGVNDSDDKFSKNQLFIHLNIIYIILFISLNASGLLFNDNAIVYQLINNCFITGLAINNIDWPEFIISIN